MNENLQKFLNTLNKLPEKDQIRILDLFTPFFLAVESTKSINQDDYSGFESLTEYSVFFRSLLGQKSKYVITETLHGLLAVDPADSIVGYYLRHYGHFGIKELESVQRFANKKSKVLIVGAHIGSLVIPLAKEVDEVVAIEANPKTYELLTLNLKLNNIGNCKSYNIAADNKNGELAFLLNTINSGGSKRKPLVEDLMYYYDSPEEIIVPCFRLDDFLKNKNFDIVVMDLEGSETFALSGMTDILRYVKTLIIEFVPHHLKNVGGVSIEDFLKELWDFDYMTIPSLNLRVNSVDFFNVLNDMYINELCDDGLIFEKRY